MYFWEATPSSFPNRADQGEQIGQLVHSDVCGPISVPAVGGFVYFVTIKDDFSGYCVIHFIKQKYEVMALFQQYVQRIKVEIGNPVVTLRSDNGGEYIGKIFESWLLENGIRHETTVAPTPTLPSKMELQRESIGPFSNQRGV